MTKSPRIVFRIRVITLAVATANSLELMQIARNHDANGSTISESGFMFRGLSRMTAVSEAR